MFAAMYPASVLREENGRGFYVRFKDLPEALTGGDDLEDSLDKLRIALRRRLRGVCEEGMPFRARAARDWRSTLPRSETRTLSGDA